jgi:hypothetical protein
MAIPILPETLYADNAAQTVHEHRELCRHIRARNAVAAEKRRTSRQGAGSPPSFPEGRRQVRGSTLKWARGGRR